MMTANAPPTAEEITQRLQQKALELGFDLFGVAAVQEVAELNLFDRWLEQGYAADMDYLGRQREKRKNPRLVVDNARSVILCAINYHTDAPFSVETADKTSAWISRYAWGDDYHEVLLAKIRALCTYLTELTAGRAASRYYVDTGPVLEKVWAKYGGIGWIGKNTCLINPEIGSFLFLASIVTDAMLHYGTPPPDRCGTCTRCLDACPTQAILAPYVLDANRCISYLTIENRGDIPEAVRQGMGRHVFGCDICQEVCPWNREAPVSSATAFQPRAGNVNPALQQLLRMNEDEFQARFRGSPVKRAKWRGLKRNAVIAAGNSAARALSDYIKPLLHDDDAMIREHAAWAYQRLLRKTKPEE